MRMANDRDQEIVRSAVPDAAASLIAFLPSLGTREAIAFGEGVPLPTRFTFKDVAESRLPRSQSGRLGRLDEGGALDDDFIRAVVDRWRESSTINTAPRIGLSALEQAGMGDEGLGAPLIPRRMGRSTSGGIVALSRLRPGVRRRPGTYPPPI
jgi:uncharacterized protein